MKWWILDPLLRNLSSDFPGTSGWIWNSSLRFERMQQQGVAYRSLLGYNAGMREYYVYMLASKRNGTLYVGMTEDIAKRIIRHKGRQANEFTAKYDVLKLVYCEKHTNLEEAVKREKQLKRWRRQWKVALIEKQNHKWQDLSSGVINTGSPVVEPEQRLLGDRRADMEFFAALREG